MSWSEKLKLNKQLISALMEAEHSAPREMQQRTLARIAGGQDLIAVGPGGCGKTTTYVLAVLNRLRYIAEGVPRVLILVPDKERVLAVIEQFERFRKNRSILLVGLYAAPGTETQMNALADGADIVVATPDRARAIYLKLGLNLNKVDLMILDDAELIVKQGLQLPVMELAASIGKCQHLVFTTVLHDKLNKMLASFMNQPALVEVEEQGEAEYDTFEQLAYHIPNFGTKLNLLSLFAEDAELFTKTIVLVNTRRTAEKIYQRLKSGLNKAAAVYKPWSFELPGFENLNEFKAAAGSRILIALNETLMETDLSSIPFLIHFELPAEKETFINRIINTGGERAETLAITFTTDLELDMVRRIEQQTGQKIPVAELPEELLIEQERKSSGKAKKKTEKDEVPAGEAFHEKKPGNAKNYNYGGGAKAKMTNKRKHS